MFNYFLSFAVAFIVFGFVWNIVKRIYHKEFSDWLEKEETVWFCITVFSAAWFITVPIIFIIVIVFILKLITDKIADFAINFINKRKKD